MRVVLISGKARHGKDTVAGMLRKELEQAHKRVLITHYADLLKFICKNYFGWNGEKDDAGRKLLQYVGTDVIRAKDPDIWVDFVKHVLEMFHNEWDFVIIPDTRFKNEVEKIESDFDTVHIRVVRDGFDNGLTENQRNHPSETALDDVRPDYTVFNNGTLSELSSQVKKLLEDTSCFCQTCIQEVFQ